MKNYFIGFVLILLVFFLGYQIGQKSELSKNSFVAHPLERPIDNDLMKLSQEEYKEYLSLKDKKAKYEIANGILNKMLLIFLADLGFRVERNNLDFIKYSQEKEMAQESSLLKEGRENSSEKSDESEQQKKSIKNYKKEIAQLKRRLKREMIKKKNNGIHHPGAIPEIPAGTVLENGDIIGEKEALKHFQRFENLLFKKLQAMQRSEFRNRFVDDVYWFQREGNFRRKQKCTAIQKMQSEFNLKISDFKKCSADMEQIHQELWGYL